VFIVYFLIYTLLDNSNIFSLATHVVITRSN